MPKNILVTGGAGFIGSHLTEELLCSGCQVTIIDNFNDFYDPAIKRRNASALLDNVGCSLVDGDIRDADLVKTTFEKGNFQQVVHLAAMAGVRPSLARPHLYNEVNLLGTLNLLEACRQFGVKKFVFASSSSVYGNNRKVPFSEVDPVDNPISPYASTKKSGELMVYTYHHLYRIKSVCLRFFTVYGPRQRPEMAIHHFTDRIAKGEEITIYGDGNTSRDYTFVSDIVSGLKACVEQDFDYEIINLGRSDAVRLSELVSKIEHYLGKEAVVKKIPCQPGDVERTFADITKAERLLNYKPAVSIDIGLEKFVNWYLNNRRH